eukprot:Skav226239  [mRNA]  locus=scaffold1218:450682:453784:+ [translate_table: standard]
MSFEKQCLTSLFLIWGLALFNDGDSSDSLVSHLLEDMWATAKYALARQWPVASLLCKLGDMQAELLRMLFPPELKTHRHSWRTGLLLASVMTIQGLLCLRQQAHLPWVQRLAHVAVGPVRHLLVDEHVEDDVIAAAIVFLRQGLEGQGQEDEACVYSLFNCNSWYIGKALLRRRHNTLGIPCRIMEHLSSIIRRNSPASRSIRAVLLRQRPAHTLGFLVLKRGQHNWIKASETVAIRALRPPGNKGQCRPIRVKHRPRKRNRPPPRFRKGRRSSCFWNSLVCVQQLLTICRKKQNFPFGQLGPVWSVQTFKQAYRQKQQVFFAKSGQSGPLSIFAPGQGGLLALWACTKSTELDTRLLVGRCRPSRVIIRLANLVTMVKGYVRQCNGYKKVDKLLKKYRLPPRRTVWFKCPDVESMRRAQMVVRTAAHFLAWKHGAFLFHWVMARAKFCLGAASRFLDRRNAVEQSKQIRISALCQQGCFAIEHYRRGDGVKKLPGNWGIQDREAVFSSHRQLQKNMQDWLRDQHVPRAVGRRCSKKLSAPDGLEQELPAAETAYIDSMTRGQNDVLLQDDKDKKVTWTMSFPCSAAFFMSLVLLDSQWEVIPMFKKRVSKLRVPMCPCACIWCRGSKPFTSLLVADAAQMYEQINTDLVLEAFDAKVALLQAKKGANTITVAKGRAVQGWPGGSEHTRSRKWLTFSMRRLRRMLQASCQLRYASIGDLVLAAKGLVIGGLLSMIAALCLLCHEEEQFLSGMGHQDFQLPDGWSLPELFLGMRYVDDLLLVSFSLCHSCLQKLVKRIYSVDFSVNPEENEQTWTDVIFCVDPVLGTISWTARNPNRAWVLSHGEKVKQRRVPFLGRLQCPFGQLRGLLLSRATRLRELELPEKVQTTCMIEELQELILEGYPVTL